MTKKQKHNPNSRFNDFNAEDDFIVDLDINSNQQELPPVPLNNTWDDDATINTLLMGTDLNAQEEVDDDDLVLLDHRPIEDIEVLDEHENVDHFAIGPIEEFEDLVEETVPVESKAPIILNKEIIDSQPDTLFVDENFELPPLKDASDLNALDEASLKSVPVMIDKDVEMVSDFNFLSEPLEEPIVPIDLEAKDSFFIEEDTSNHPVNSSVDYQTEALNYQNDAGLDSFDTKTLAQINVDDTQIKQLKRLSFIALGVSGLALLCAIGLGIAVFNLHNQVSKLKDLTSILEEDVSAFTEKTSQIEGGSHIAIESVNPSADNPVIGTENRGVKNDHPHEKPKKAREAAVIETTFDLPVDHKSNSQATLTSIKAEKIKTKAVEVNRKKIAVEVAHKETKASVKEHVLAKKESISISKAWAVNLIAFKDPTEARKKATKLIQQGIPVKVITFNANKTAWYQLRVGGFKNKINASSYADKVKKSFNLDSVSVNSL